VKLRDFLVVLRTRWRIVLACLAAVVGIAAALTYTQTPIYTTHSSFFLQATDPTPEEGASATARPPRSHAASRGTPQSELHAQRPGARRMTDCRVRQTL
jgi:uncharacterized protein involved in exopolysaccharide biosynthesis